MTIGQIALTVLSAFGGAAVISAAIAAWFGNFWATKIAQSQKAKLDQELEHIKSQLSQAEQGNIDALIRRRDVYARLSKGLRVFVERNSPVSDKEKQAFLEAYDEACVWASEDVIQALGRFLDLKMGHTASGFQTPTMEDLKNAYKECVSQMRKDVGFEQTTFQYRFVKFQQ